MHCCIKAPVSYDYNSTGQHYSILFIFHTHFLPRSHESAEISFYKLVLFFFPYNDQKWKCWPDHFVNNLSRKHYYNVLQGWKTDLILKDEGKKEPAPFLFLRQQFFVFATEGRYRSAIFKVSVKKRKTHFSGPGDFSLHKWILSLWLLSQCFLPGLGSVLHDCARTLTAAVEKKQGIKKKKKISRKRS